MAFRHRSAAKTASKPAPKPAPTRKAALPAKPAARRPAPPAPPAEQPEEEFFDEPTVDEGANGHEFVDEQEVAGEDEFYEEEREQTSRPPQRASQHSAPAPRSAGRPSFSRPAQSGAGATSDDKIRLTGIWESKGSADILRGGLQDVGAIADWIVRAADAGKKVQVLTYRNNVRNQNDPPFTVYLQIDNYVPGQRGGGSRGGWGRGRSAGGNYNRGGGDSRDRF